MGQSTSSSSAETNLIEDTVSGIHYEIKKNAQCLMEIGSLTYEDFSKCLSSLNEMSRNCLDTNRKLTVFAVKKGSDQTFLWKATVRIACLKCDPDTKKVESYKWIDLTKFLKVFHTFQSHLEAMSKSEEQNDERRLMTLLTDVTQLSPIGGIGASSESSECCICLDRKPDVILPCTHVFCGPCIEKWNSTHKSCPICKEKLSSTDESWVFSELPEADEINEQILTVLTDLTKQNSTISSGTDSDDD